MPQQFKFDWVVLLRDEQPARPQAGKTLAKAKPGYRVVQQRMTLAEARELSRDRDYLGGAPALPLSLIRATPGAPAPDGGWGLRATGAGRSLWDGAGVRVAVLDAGFDDGLAAAEAFRGVKITRRNFMQSPDSAAIDDHAAHVAATIFGRDVGGVRVGVARGVTEALIGKVVDDAGGSTLDLARAIHGAHAWGADVICMALTIDFTRYRERVARDYGLDPRQATGIALDGYAQTIQLFDALSLAARGGPAIVAAAGNGSRSPAYSIQASPPASAMHFLSVAALTRDAGGVALAPFSNVGARLAAPGADILSVGRAGLQSFSGTSAAAAHVAGLACLWAQKLREDGRAGGDAVADALDASCHPLAGIADDDVAWGAAQAPS